MGRKLYKKKTQKSTIACSDVVKANSVHPHHIVFPTITTYFFIGISMFMRAQGHFIHETESPDHYTSSTLIGGEGGAGPSLLHTSLEGPIEYLNASWM